MSPEQPHPHTHHHHSPASAPPTPERVLDPVCGMKVDPAQARGGQSVYRGTTYSFCNPKCKTKFDADPEHYVKPEPDQSAADMGPSCCHGHGHTSAKPPAPVAASADAGAIYTCPMHPEVRQVGPGTCPECGMALEPEQPTLEETENPELVDMTRRFFLSAALTLPLFLLAMSEMLPGEPLQHALGARLIGWLQLALATPVVLWGGWPFFVRGAQSVRNRRLNMFTLIALGTGAAYLFSLVGQLVPGLLPAAFRGHGGAVPLYFESAGVIVTLVLLGQVLELRAREQTSGALKALLGLAPKTGATAPRVASYAHTDPSRWSLSTRSPGRTCAASHAYAARSSGVTTE